MKFILILISLMTVSITALAEGYKYEIITSFPDSGVIFQPSNEIREQLKSTPNASIIYINGRTSTNNPSARDDYATR